MTALSPYEAMLKERRSRGRKSSGSTVRLSDYQRDQRKKAANIAARRAQEVLVARYHDEYLSVLRAERSALYAMIDAEAESGGDRSLAELLQEQRKRVMD